MRDATADWREAVARGERPPRMVTPKRYRVHQQARLVLGPDLLLPCIVRDLSPLGAKVRLTRVVRLPDTFDLVIAGHDLRTHRVTLCWQRGDFAGLAFTASASAQALPAPATDQG